MWAQELDCSTDTHLDLIHRYATQVGDFIDQYSVTPTSGVLDVTLVITPRVADVTSRLDGNGVSVYVFAPVPEVDEWDRKFRDELLKYMH